LEKWAFRNPSIWGNNAGYSLFASKASYNNAETITEIVKHLEGVRDRSPE
jgi:hypothetical protein